MTNPQHDQSTTNAHDSSKKQTLRAQKLDLKLKSNFVTITKLDFQVQTSINLLAGKSFIPFIDVEIFITWNKANKICGKADAFPHILFALLQVIKILSSWKVPYKVPANTNKAKYT